MSTEIYNGKYMKLRDWIPFEKLYWEWLSENPNAIPILEKNLDNVKWKELYENPNAIHILEKNLDKIKYDTLEWLFTNPNIFTYDYEAMKNAMYKEGGFVEELMANRFHPKNMKKWNDWGFPTIHDDDDN